MGASYFIPAVIGLTTAYDITSKSQSDGGSFLTYNDPLNLTVYQAEQGSLGSFW